jgi:hypothetical protein
MIPLTRLTLVAAVVALVIVTDVRPARAAAYTITVNAGTQTSGNPRFWSATVGTGTATLTLRPDLQTHYKLANRELGMLRVRGHGVLNDDMGHLPLVGHRLADLHVDELRQVPGGDRRGGDAPVRRAQLHARRPVD